MFFCISVFRIENSILHFSQHIRFREECTTSNSRSALWRCFNVMSFIWEQISHAQPSKWMWFPGSAELPKKKYCTEVVRAGASALCPLSLLHPLNSVLETWAFAWVSEAASSMLFCFVLGGEKRRYESLFRNFCSLVWNFVLTWISVLFQGLGPKFFGKEKYSTKMWIFNNSWLLLLPVSLLFSPRPKRLEPVVARKKPSLSLSFYVFPTSLCPCLHSLSPMPASGDGSLMMSLLAPIRG